MQKLSVLQISKRGPLFDLFDLINLQIFRFNYLKPKKLQGDKTCVLSPILNSTGCKARELIVGGLTF
ncbi:MAG: hypothetical protein A2048_10850 [Deltaproteobacteria bacterium GWA2_45_12]|nr:MAG: hypothetical protein A2048_10850 [Deltaproteobacteria bacterium GWA2_45_12]